MKTFAVGPRKHAASSRGVSGRWALAAATVLPLIGNGMAAQLTPSPLTGTGSPAEPACFKQLDLQRHAVHVRLVSLNDEIQKLKNSPDAAMPGELDVVGGQLSKMMCSLYNQVYQGDVSVTSLFVKESECLTKNAQDASAVDMHVRVMKTATDQMADIIERQCRAALGR